MSSPGIHPVEPVGIPEPGLRPEIVESVQSILESLAAVEAPLRTWQIGLGCGHHLIYEQHADLHAPDMVPMICDSCTSTHQQVLESCPVDLERERAHHLQQAREELRRAHEHARGLHRQVVLAQQRITQAQACLEALTAG